MKQRFLCTFVSDSVALRLFASSDFSIILILADCFRFLPLVLSETKQNKNLLFICELKIALKSNTNM